MSSLAGSFLVARPILLDPNFRHTVVLLIHHDSQGAFGVVVNRPTEVEGLPFRVFAGGPCPSEGLLMLHGHPEWGEEEEPGKEVAPGVFLGNAACVDRVTEAADAESLHYRMFAGYSGWGPGQLEGELGTGAWAVVPARAALLFETPVDELWERLLPPAIPQPSLN